MKSRILLSLALCVLAAPLSSFARPQNAAKPASPAQNGKQPAGFHAEFFANLDEVQEKIMDLAESTPADKFAWRPGHDVRTIAEVYMHIAGGNYFLSTFIGSEGRKPNLDLEKNFRTKAEVIAELNRSFEHLRSSVRNAQNLDKPVKMFGKTTTHRAVLMTMLSHLHEHLGQSIAYARMNGIVPPWSR
jgi:uncharacterized damage-inducible protein DinB